MSQYSQSNEQNQSGASGLTNSYNNYVTGTSTNSLSTGSITTTIPPVSVINNNQVLESSVRRFLEDTCYNNSIRGENGIRYGYNNIDGNTFNNLSQNNYYQSNPGPSNQYTFNNSTTYYNGLSNFNDTTNPFYYNSTYNNQGYYNNTAYSSTSGTALHASAPEFVPQFNNLSLEDSSNKYNPKSSFSSTNAQIVSSSATEDTTKSIDTKNSTYKYTNNNNNNSRNRSSKKDKYQRNNSDVYNNHRSERLETNRNLENENSNNYQNRRSQNNQNRNQYQKYDNHRHNKRRDNWNRNRVNELNESSTTNNNTSNSNNNFINSQNSPRKSNSEHSSPRSIKDSPKKTQLIINVSSPENEKLSQREKLIREIEGRRLECLVCVECIKMHQHVWSCLNCYHIFHLNCIIKWASSSKSEDGWRCPACQNTLKHIPREYYCFCGKVKNPEYNRNDLAHSCGELCGRKDNCSHPCTLLCHPGPCPPCQALITRQCGCGKTVKSMQCYLKEEIECDLKCGKLLNCELHECEEKCHQGKCPACTHKIDQNCYCGKNERQVTCTRETIEKKTYSCGKPCGKDLACTNHKCKDVCHKGDCKPCKMIPELITTCPCGKMAVAKNERKSCLDPVPVCPGICGKTLKCGSPSKPHHCISKCHVGNCPPCNKQTAVKCRCGHMDQMIKCRQLSTRADDARCKKRCTKKRSCGKHKCNQECCIDIDHICPMPCNYTLTCGKHKCDQPCHRGNCPPCYRSSFDELYCECGANVIYPPVPCGTKRPACDRPCSRQHTCDHPVQQPIGDQKSRDQLGMLKTTYNLKEPPEISSAFYFDLTLRTFLAVREMLQAGAWPKDMKYMTCEEFEGNNAPEREIDLLSYFINIKEPTTYGEFFFDVTKNVPVNGHSYMKYEMDISVVSIRSGASVNTKSIGSWKAGLDAPLDVKDTEQMKNLTADTVYRVYTVVQAPFIMKDKNAPKGYKGYCIDLIDEIAKIVKFDYEIYEVEDGKFGNMDENGDWNGIVRKLVDKQADIGLGSMSVMAEREIVIDFTVPYYDLVGITIMMQRPMAPSSLFKFLTVLETNVWLCILAAYFFTSFLMWVFDRWSPYSYQNNREKYKDDDEKREFNLKECLWFCMTSLTPQGGGEAPKNLSGRLVAATWWLFGFIIIASYTANLAAFLTVSRLDTPVESLDDLAKQYKILYAPLNGSSAMTYFQRMADIEQRFYEIWKDLSLNDSLSPLERSKLAVWDYPVSDKYTKMWQAMQEAGLPATLNEAVARVKNSTAATGFAFLGDATDIRYLVMTNCDLQVVGEEFSRKPYAIAVQQGSHLKDQFNNAILMLLNKRQLEKLKEKWWKDEEAQSKCDKPEDQSDGISIQNIGGVFIVIFVGIGLACITLVFEYWWYKYRKNSRVVDVSEMNAQMKDELRNEGVLLGTSSNKDSKSNAGGAGVLRPSTCHSATQCPPCFVLTTKWCFGHHEQRKTIPCNQESFSCGMPCGKDLRCGRHKCIKSCHEGLCEIETDICKQPCKTKRYDCGHPCMAPCHEDECPDTPCKELVEVQCECGNRKQQKTCQEVSREQRRMATAALASSITEISDIMGPMKSTSNKMLECTEECKVLERNRRLAIGLQIRNPDTSQKLLTRYSDFVKSWAKKDPHLVKSIHDALTDLVQLAKQSQQKNRRHSFPVMNREKRQLVHEMCGMFGVDSEAYDAEPNRNVVATAYKERSWLPAMSIMEVMKRETGQRRVPVPNNNAWGVKK